MDHGHTRALNDRAWKQPRGRPAVAAVRLL